jgi:hypothetical protein
MNEIAMELFGFQSGKGLKVGFYSRDEHIHYNETGQHIFAQECN